MPPLAARMLVFSTVIALAGCSSPPVEVVSPSPRASQTGEPVLAAAPQSRVPLGCDDLEDLAVEAMQVQAKVVDGGWSGLTAGKPVGALPGAIAGLQAGTLSCTWEESTPDRSGAWFSLQVLPDAENAFAAQLPPEYPEDYVAGIRGSGSLMLCAGDVGNRCTVSYLVHGYWVIVSLELSREPDDGASLRQQLVLGAADAIADLLGAAGPARPPFVPDSQSLAAWSDCDQLDSPGLDLEPFEPSASGIPFEAAVAAHVGYVACSGDPGPDQNHLTVGILPGSGWVFDGAWLSGGSIYGDTTSVEVAGADKAALVGFLEGTDGAAQIWRLTARVEGSVVDLEFFFEDDATVDRQRTVVALSEQLIAAMTALP